MSSVFSLRTCHGIVIPPRFGRSANILAPRLDGLDGLIDGSWCVDGSSVELLRYDPQPQNGMFRLDCQSQLNIIRNFKVNDCVKKVILTIAHLSHQFHRVIILWFIMHIVK